MNSNKDLKSINGELLIDVKQLIDEARNHVAVTVNSSTSILYWSVGSRIQTDILQYKRADYGKFVIKKLSEQLTIEYGKGWSSKQLHHCLRFAETFTDKEIVYALSRQLSWTHFRTLIYIKDDLKREFYVEMTRIEKWNTRILNDKIDSMLFERTSISKQQQEVIREELKNLREEDLLSPELVFRDPYFLGFLGLEDRYSEKTLEDAILREIEKFILELGQGFAFLERQKRMLIDGDSFKLDLLFYHRKLKRLVAIDLKLGRFKASYKGQMELYLRYLEKHETESGENSPIGLILCAEGSKEQIELLQLGESGIRVSEYITELPSKEILKKKLHKVIELERERAEIKRLNK